MKNRLQGLIIGVLLGAILTSGVAFAKQATETINVIYDNIKILIDGKEYKPTDANGNIVEPFIYNGTTYLPVRAIANAFNKDVDWEAQTSTVILGSKNYDWLDQMGYVDYETSRTASEAYSISNYNCTKNNSIISIKRGLNFVVTNPDWNKGTENIDRTSISYLLNQNYKKFTTDIIAVDEYYASDIKPSVINIYGDDEILYSSPRITESSNIIPVEIDVTSIKCLKIEVVTELQNTDSVCGTDRKRFILLSDARLSKE